MYAICIDKSHKLCRVSFALIRSIELSTYVFIVFLARRSADIGASILCVVATYLDVFVGGLSMLL